MLTIRGCRPEDYTGISVIVSLTRSEPFSAEELMEEDRRARIAGAFTRLVAADEQGRIVGYGCAEQFPWMPEGEWELYAVAHPDHRRCGVGSAIYKAVEQIALEGGATSFSAYCRSTDPYFLQWAQRRGFEADLHRTEAVLDLTEWDGSRFAGHIAQVRASSICLEFFDGETPEEIVRGIWEVERLTGPDVPDYRPDAPFPAFEIYWQMWREYKEPRLTVVALDGDRVVGTSFLFYSHRPGKGAYTGYTGVLRPYRGNGLALALKLLTIEGAVARGVSRMRTNNDFENPPMLAVNEKLGYQLVPGPIRLKKSL